MRPLPALAALLAATAVLLVPARAQESAPADGLEHFERCVRPVLVERCYECHSSRARRLKGGLSLESREGWVRGGLSGAAVVPGDPDASLVVQAVRYTDEELQMPPAGRLPAAEVAALEEWVRGGAPDPRVEGASKEPVPPATIDMEAARAHWAFRPMAAGKPPRVRDESWPAGAIDTFVLARLEVEGLRPAPGADRRTLLRRASFALTGLPPTRAEVAALEADTRPGAWERAVDRLLASPHLGERWARTWLDLARYSDSNGLDENLALGEAWRYRDWVVRAFDADLPYDRFLTLQLAGDLLPEPEEAGELADRLTATGLLVLGPKMLAEQDKEKLVMDVVDEQMDVAARTFLGLTVGCARCHDHKFDPLSQADYYSLAGVFRSTSTLASLDHVSRWRERELAPRAVLAERDARRETLEAARGEEQRLRAEADAALLPLWRSQVSAYLLAGQHAARRALLVEAEQASRTNLIVDAQQYGSPDVVVARTGRAGPQFAEYDLTLAQAGRWQLEVRLAAQESRPMRVLLDGAVVAEEALGATTGSWMPDTQTWVRVAALTLRPGRNVLRLERDGPVPHLDRLALVPLEDGEERSGWPVAGNPWAEGLVPALVRRWAERLERAARTDDPLYAPWHAFAALPPDDFEARAAALFAGLRARRDAGELGWNPLALRLVDGLPPASLRELAGRYQALFSGVDRAWQQALADAREVPPQGLSDEAAEALRRELHGPASPLALARADLEPFYPAAQRELLAAARARREELEREPLPAFERALAVQDVERPVDQALLVRGSHLAPSAPQPRGVPPGLASLFDWLPVPDVPAGASGRLELARWMTHPEHPLTARVMANRVWQQLFGEGLVRSTSNFGLRGEAPSHPELLDHLARELVRGGWSVKALARQVLLSRTWRMDSAHDPAAAARDPENRFLWRQHRRRLQAEELRDALLAAAGRLDLERGGSLLDTPNRGYVTNDQSADQARYDSTRRSLYLPIVRNAMFDLYAAFDYSDPSVTIERRSSTVGAPQALVLLNSPLARESARALARLALDQRPDPASRVQAMYERALQRPPTAGEAARALEFVRQQAAGAADMPGATSAARPTHEDAAAADGLDSWSALAQVLLVSNEFLYVD